MATQKELAEWIGLTDRQVRNLQSQGFIHKARGAGGIDLQRAVKEYINYVKSGLEQTPDFDPDEPTSGGARGEEAKQDLRRKTLNADLMEEKLKIMRGEYAPIAVLGDALNKVLGSVSARLNSLPMQAKLADPSLSGRAIDTLKTAIAECKNDCARAYLDIPDYSDGFEELDPSDPEPAGEQTADDGGGVGR